MHVYKTAPKNYTGKRNIIFLFVFLFAFLNLTFWCWCFQCFWCVYSFLLLFFLCFCRAFSLFIIMAQPVCQWKSSHHTIQNFRTAHVFRFGSLLSVIMDRVDIRKVIKWFDIKYMEFIYDVGMVNGENDFARNRIRCVHWTPTVTRAINILLNGWDKRAKLLCLLHTRFHTLYTYWTRRSNVSISSRRIRLWFATIRISC